MICGIVLAGEGADGRGTDGWGELDGRHQKLGALARGGGTWKVLSRVSGARRGRGRDLCSHKTIGQQKVGQRQDGAWVRTFV